MLIPSGIDIETAGHHPRDSSSLGSLRARVKIDLLSIVEDAEDRHAVHDEFDRWVATVRDPASEASEGIRIIGSRELKAEAFYEIASLPDGRYALTFGFSYLSGDGRGHGSPWNAYDGRESCVATFLDAARRYFSQPIHGVEDQDDVTYGYKSQREAQKKMQALLEGDGLFGFMEPEPATVGSDPSED